MTRKRFVKLLMALGYSRNWANTRAEQARRVGYSYAEQWGHECDIIQRQIRAVSEAVVKLSDELCSWVSNVAVLLTQAAARLPRDRKEV